MQQIECISNKFYTNVDINDAYRIDAKPYVERPFFLEEVKFTTSDARYSPLSNTVQFLPGDVIRSNPSLLNAMKIGAYYRADLTINASIAGNITLAGTVLMGVLPPLFAFPVGNQVKLINTILSSPHAFLYANEATSATVQCPWYCNSDMATLDMDNTPGYTQSLDLTTKNGNYGTLVFIVLNPLAPSTGSSTSVSIVVEASFKHLDILVPTPRVVTWTAQSAFLSGLLDMGRDGLKELAGDGIDAARGYIREWTGLHNPNTSRIEERIIQTRRNFPNVVDNEQFFEKLDPNSDFNRILQSPIYGTDVDEQSLDHIVSKKQMLGTFKVDVADPVGKLYWVRPISPFQGGLGQLGLGQQYIQCANNIELLHSLHRAWRGDLKLYITAVMNNKQQVKLKVLKMYNPSVQSSMSYPVYKSIVNAPSHLLEFTQGGQEHEISLPFVCRNDLIPCAEDMTLEGLFHGLYYIYLAQPMANSDGSPTTIEFNVFMSGEPSLTFYGYVNKKLTPAPFDIVNTPGLLQGRLDTIFMPSGTKEFHPPSDTFLRKPKVKLSKELKGKTIAEIDKVHPGTAQLNPLYRTGDNYIFMPIKWKAQTKRTQDQPEWMECASADSVVLTTATAASLYTSMVLLWKFLKRRLLPSCAAPRKIPQNAFKPQSGMGNTIKVMNAPQKQEGTSSRDDMAASISHFDRLKPNLDIRPLVRRMYKTLNFKLTGPASSAAEITLPLAALVAEDPINRIFTPIDLISRMYYGKNVGFKIKGVFNSPTPSLEKLVVRCFYVPPNMAYLATNQTVVAAGINSSAIPSLTVPSYTDQPPPLTFQIDPIETTFTATSFEFVIPDVTFYKFMGSPNKYRDTTIIYDQLSTADFGHLIVSIENFGTEEVNPILSLFCGLTDESRFGFHSVAPPYLINKLGSIYTGDPASPTNPTLATLNPFIYKGGFL